MLSAILRDFEGVRLSVLFQEKRILKIFG